MARTKKSEALNSTIVAGRELRSRATKVEYNVQKLSDQSVVVPKAPASKKKASTSTATAKKTGKKAVKKGGKKTSATYFTLVTRALKGVESPGISVHKIVAFLEKKYPDKTDRKHVLAALHHGVDKKLFVKAKGSYRLSKKAQDAMKKKQKKATKKTTTKKSAIKKSTKKTTKKSTTKKSATKKSATKKSTTKKSGTKKTKTAEKEKKTPKTSKRSAEEQSETPAKSPKKTKKVIGPPSDDEQPTGEARGVWQYYDNGWFNYADDAIRIVEGVFQEYNADNSLVIRDIQSGHFKYSINFNTMEQTNAQTGTMRKIRRV